MRNNKTLVTTLLLITITIVTGIHETLTEIPYEASLKGDGQGRVVRQRYFGISNSKVRTTNFQIRSITKQWKSWDGVTCSEDNDCLPLMHCNSNNSRCECELAGTPGIL